MFWQVGSSATLGTTTSFLGNILALSSITLNNGASINGRALARNGAVTLDTNTVSAVACSAAPTATPVPATATPVPPTATPLPATATATATPTNSPREPPPIVIPTADLPPTRTPTVAPRATATAPATATTTRTAVPLPVPVPVPAVPLVPVQAAQVQVAPATPIQIVAVPGEVALQPGVVELPAGVVIEVPGEPDLGTVVAVAPVLVEIPSGGTSTSLERGPPATGVGDAAASFVWTVQPDDTLESIAAAYYGDSAFAWSLYEANRDLLDERGLLPGDVLVLP